MKWLSYVADLFDDGVNFMLQGEAAVRSKPSRAIADQIRRKDPTTPAKRLSK